MDRPYESDTVAAAPSMPPNLPNGYPSDGDPNAGRLATEPGAYWFHAVNEEIRNVIAGGGLTPSNAELNQLFLAIKAMIKAESQSIVNMSHPVGSLLLMTTSEDPSELLGGKWERYAQGRMLVSAQDSGTYAAGNTGGAETCTLSTDNLPSHSHDASMGSAGGHTHDRGSQNITGEFATSRADNHYTGVFARTASGKFSNRQDASDGHYVSFTASKNWSGASSSAGAHAHTITIGNTGGGTAFSLLSPWVAVYVWRRVS